MTFLRINVSSLLPIICYGFILSLVIRISLKGRAGQGLNVGGPNKFWQPVQVSSTGTVYVCSSHCRVQHSVLAVNNNTITLVSLHGSMMFDVV